MPEFGAPVKEQLRLRVLELAAQYVAKNPQANTVPAGDYVLEPADAIVLDHAASELDGYKLDVNVCRPGWSPPFEWLAEFTYYDESQPYLPHYLVRDSDIVLAQRRELTVIDDAEAGRIVGWLEQALADLA